MQTIKKKSLSEEVVHPLLTSVVDGKLKAGETLPSETELWNVFGVSRTAIREGKGSKHWRGSAS